MAPSSIIGISMLGVRIFFSYLLRPYFGGMVIAYAEAIAWVISCAVYLLRLQQITKRIDPA